VNVCANVAHKPPICANKPDAPGYQVVVPKAVDEPEEDLATSDFYADDDHYYGSLSDDAASGSGPSGGHADDAAALERWRKRQEPLHRAARAAPEPTECHALGSLSNVSWGLIVAGKPELGLELRYRGGDECLKRVVRKRQAGDPPPSSALNAAAQGYAGKLREFTATLDIPVISYLRDTQYYVHLAAHGLSMFDITPSKVQKDLEQWAPICAWLDA
jgi:hypothetical protein